MGEKLLKRWQCRNCGYLYDPRAGDQEGGVEPGTAFHDLPADWHCPQCGAPREDFEPYDE